jgi:hypothetical protein
VSRKRGGVQSMHLLLLSFTISQKEEDRGKFSLRLTCYLFTGPEYGSGSAEMEVELGIL